MRKILFFLLALAFSMVFFPSIFVLYHKNMVLAQKKTSLFLRKYKETDILNKKNAKILIPIYFTSQNKLIAVPLEECVENVVVGEMPADFHMEALKAQAIAARTYLFSLFLKFKDRNSKNNTYFFIVNEKMRLKVKGYKGDQLAYIPREKIKDYLKDNYAKFQNIQQAVKLTEGKVITYKGEIVYTPFFSTSNGKTEDPNDFLNINLPWLKSIDSSWDRYSPKFYNVRFLSLREMLQLLEKNTKKKLLLPVNNSFSINILSRTKGQRVSKIRIGGQCYSGKEFRQALNIPSADFDITLIGKKIKIVTRGYGHGLGMSQFGANYLATKGKDFLEILKYYYKGIEVSSLKGIGF